MPNDRYSLPWEKTGNPGFLHTPNKAGRPANSRRMTSKSGRRLKRLVHRCRFGSCWWKLSWIFLDSDYPCPKVGLATFWTAKILGGIFFVVWIGVCPILQGGSIVGSHTYLEPDHKFSWKFLALSLPFKKATCPNMFSNIHFVQRLQLLGWCQISVYYSNSFHHHICLFKDFYGSNLFLNQGNQPINWRFSQSRPVTSRVLNRPISRYKKANWNQRSLLWRCRAASDRCGEKIVATMTDRHATEEKWTEIFVEGELGLTHDRCIYIYMMYVFFLYRFTYLCKIWDLQNL